MSVIGSNILAGASGAAGGDKVYVDDVFSTYVYEGKTTAQAIPNGIDLDGEGGLIWIKKRSSGSHSLTDTVTGIDKNLITNSTNPQATDANRITAVSANGFTLYGDGTNVNTNGDNFVSWTFRKAPGCFDIVTYSGSSSNQTIPHSLGCVPGMIIVKNLTKNPGESWAVYHKDVGRLNSLYLNETSSQSGTVTDWAYTTPTADNFYVGSSSDKTGRDGHNYVAYLFASDEPVFGTDGDESIIKCGTYTGTNAENIINVGFEPQYFFIKKTNGSGLWMCWDFMRGAANNSTNQPSLYFTSADAESPFGHAYVHQNGFAFSNSDTDFNVSGGTFIYMAIRRPNKPPETGADVFAIDTRGGTSPTPPTFYSGFPVDFSIRRDTTADDWHFRTRMTGEAGLLFPNQTLGETSNSSSTVTFDRMDGTGFNTGADSANYSWMFKRAPGFFDVVAYNSVSGGGVSNSQNHNLGVAPEMIIVKKRDALSGWPVYHTATGLTTSTKLHSPYIDTGAGSYWESAPTSTQFFPYGSDTNNTGSWIAYLFASLDGISSVGTYNGTTGDQEIDCGFIAGARFVLIKRTNSTSDWFLWDTTRGINDGANPNDPYIKLNHDEAQVTNTNLIDPLPEGFIAKNTDADINAVGGTYLYLAIA